MNAWGDHPGYQIRGVPLDGVGRVTLGGVTIAESRRCLLVRESDHQDQLYFPLADVPGLEPSEHRTFCPFKGTASWFHLAGLRDAVWTYPTPSPEVAGIVGFLGFSAEEFMVTASIPFDDATAATVTFPMWGTAAELAHLMDAVPAGGDAFDLPTFPEPPVGTFFDLPWHRERRNVVESGQLLGSAVVAAAKTRPDQRVTSAHLAFLKGASFDEPIHLELETHRSGATLSAFGVRLEQSGTLRASGLVTCDTGAEDLIRHTVAMPDVPPPSQCPTHDFGVLGRETRVVGDAYAQHATALGPPELHTWTRFTGDPGEPAMHQALLAQAATHYSIAAALRHHDGISELDAHRTVSMGPVSATISFHDDVDVTRWLLTETSSIWAGRGSAHSEARVFTEDGRLVASKTVRSIIRSFASRPQRDHTTAM